MGVSKGMNESLPTQGSKRLSDGTFVTVDIPNPLPIDDTLGGVANHEAYHAVVGDAQGYTVLEISNVPGPGYGGYTRFSSEVDGATMLAPLAHGCGGTGGDEEMHERAGYSRGSSVSVSRRIAKDRNRFRKAIATAVGRERVVGRGRFQQIKAREARGDTAIARVVSPDGQVKIIEKRGVKDEKQIEIPREDFKMTA